MFGRWVSPAAYRASAYLRDEDAARTRPPSLCPIRDKGLHALRSCLPLVSSKKTHLLHVIAPPIISEAGRLQFAVSEREREGCICIAASLLYSNRACVGLVLPSKLLNPDHHQIPLSLSDAFLSQSFTASFVRNTSVRPAQKGL